MSRATNNHWIGGWRRVCLDAVKKRKISSPCPYPSSSVVQPAAQAVHRLSWYFPISDPFLCVSGLLPQLLLSFSALRNGQKILRCDTPQDSLTSIHGLRFLSLAWVILVHTYLQVFAIAGKYIARDHETDYAWCSHGGLPGYDMLSDRLSPTFRETYCLHLQVVSTFPQEQYSLLDYDAVWLCNRSLPPGAIYKYY
jgi:hypothetical protein